MQCVNNLKQIGLAIHNYESTNSSLPLVGYNFWGPLVPIAAYIEQGNVYNTINFLNSPTGTGWRYYEAPNTTATRLTINSFQCPSDVDRLTSADGHFSYSGNAGSSADTIASGNTGNYNGPFNRKSQSSAIGFRNIIDGLSNTAAFSEQVKGIGTANTIDPLRPSSTIVNVTWTATTFSPTTDEAVCLAAPPVPGASLDTTAVYTKGTTWTSGFVSGAQYNHVMMPNTWSCATGKVANAVNSASDAGSRHPGVVNVCLLDGSVKAIKSSIAKATWWALGTMAGGEIISSDAL